MLKRRAGALLIGLPLVAVVIEVVLALVLSERRGLILVPFGLLASATNYRRLKLATKLSRGRR